jgi:hypothetical protein
MPIVKVNGIPIEVRGSTCPHYIDASMCQQYSNVHEFNQLNTQSIIANHDNNPQYRDIFDNIYDAYRFTKFISHTWDDAVHDTANFIIGVMLK